MNWFERRGLLLLVPLLLLFSIPCTALAGPFFSSTGLTRIVFNPDGSKTYYFYPDRQADDWLTRYAPDRGFSLVPTPTAPPSIQYPSLFRFLLTFEGLYRWKPYIPATPDPEPDPEPTPPPTPEPPPAPEESSSSPEGMVLTEDEARMLALVNREREKMGLHPLQVDPVLVRLARQKCQDMIEQGYFGHISPTLGSPFDMMRAAGVEYFTAGENLAGAATVESAHQALMASSGHRANILNPNYTHIGIGVVAGGPYGKMFCQLFVGR